ncbi:MAG: hypothetical protein OXH76_21245 [Boseongicola sp.]|nr:hypothetical protein [Boseongicola sp.]
MDRLMLRGRIVGWARKRTCKAPFAAELVARQTECPVEEVLDVLKTSPTCRLVHVQGDVEFFSLTRDLPEACR